MKAQGFTNTKKPSKKKLKEWHERSAKAIAETGRVCIGVMGEDSDDPEFTYTLGNHFTQDTAEVISFYPSKDTMQFVLNSFSDQLKEGNVPDLCESEATLVYGLLGADGELPVRARLLTSMERVIAWEKWTCQIPSAGIPVVIIDLPDPNGHFADSDECAPPVREAYERQPFTAEVK